MRILSIDGGGVRGVLPAEIISRLGQSCSGWLDHIDLFAGTSTGAIVAAALAAGLSPEAVVRLYEEHAAVIFAPRDFVDTAVGSLDEYVRANYSRDGLHEALVGVFGDATLGDLPKRVLIPTFYLGHGGPETANTRPASIKVLHNFDGEGNDRHVKVVDALEATSAAPLYFPAKGPIDGRLPGRFIDGGVALNSPAAAALAKALKSLHSEGQGSYGKIALLSLSCGSNPRVIAGGDWGARQWVVKGAPLINVIFDGMPGSADYIVRHVLDALGGTYLRFDPPLGREVGLDDHTAVPDLLALARSLDISEVETWVEQWVTARAES